MPALGQKRSCSAATIVFIRSTRLRAAEMLAHPLRHFRLALDHKARCLASLESAANRRRDERALLALAEPLEAMGLCLSASSWALSSVSSTFSASRLIFRRFITSPLLPSSTICSVLLCLSCSRLFSKRHVDMANSARSKSLSASISSIDCGSLARRRDVVSLQAGALQRK